MNCILLLLCVAICVSLPLCDARRRPKIYGGEVSDPSDFKYHVAILKLNSTNGSTQHICGGAIIHRRFVLTAAHCVYNRRSAELIIRSGGSQAPPKNKPHLEKRTFKRVAKIMYPKEYIRDPHYHEYDVAVIKIVGSFDLADEESFKKVQLPVIDNDYEGQWAMVAGYGVQNSSELQTKAEGNGFRFLPTQVIATEDCQDTRTYILTRGSLCTQSFEKKGHTCYGDGGDPLVYDNQIIGILNAPSTCDPALPELFTRVSTYVPFVRKILEGRVTSDVAFN